MAAVDYSSPQAEAEDAAFVKQAATQQDADLAKQNPSAAQVLPSAPMHWLSQSSLGRATLSGIDTAVGTAENMWNSVPARPARDIAAGAVTGAVNTVDAAKSALTTGAHAAAAEGDPVGQGVSEILNVADPLWDHAKAHVLDFRDAVAVQDPTIADSLTQSVAQLAIPFTGYSRLLGGMGTVAKAFVAGGITDATALAPHDGRLADLIALGRHTDGKLGDALRTLAPDGSAINAYINFLTDRTNETEAEGRFRNVLDGFGANLIATPLLHGAAVVMKQGMPALRYLAENGVRNTLSDLAAPMKTPGGPAAQAGKIGYHGTPNAPFPEFDDNAIGSGQGAQSYGHGHYIAENADTGETYQKSLSGRMNNSAALSDAQAAIRAAGGDKVKAYQTMTDMAANEKQADVRMRQQNAARLIKSGNADNGKGSLLKVDIDDKHIENMLDLDKPLEEQPHVLSKIPMKDQEAMQQVLDEHGQDLELNELTGNEFRQLVERSVSENALPPSSVDDGNIPRQASEYLSNQGIPGNKYFDRKSRITGEGTRNYVVFRGKHIKVLGEK